MTRLTQAEKIQPHWWRKSFTACFLGLSLSYGVIAVFAWFGPGGIEAPMKVQMNMWLISFIWLPIIAFSFLFRTAMSAFSYLMSANLIVYSLFAVLWWIK